MAKAATPAAPDALYCSFCGKSQHEVLKLIAGPTVFICDECVELCVDIIDGDGSKHVGPTDFFEQRRFKRRERHIFYACPFRQPFDDIYLHTLKPTIVAAGWSIERADENFATGVVIRQIWEAINSCELVVADVTDKSPNVMYEIGMAHALHKPLMMVTQDVNDVPFDLRHHRFIVYENNEAGLLKLSNALVRTAQTRDEKRAPAAAAAAPSN